MIKSSRTITLVLVGSAAAALTSAPLLFTHSSPPDDAGDFDGTWDSFAATQPSTRPTGSSPYYSSGYHSGSHYYYYGSHSADSEFGSGSTGRSTSGSHSGTSRGGFGATGHGHAGS